MIIIDVDFAKANKRIANLVKRKNRLEPVLRKAGEYLKRETELEFATEKDFNGLPWKPLSEAYKKTKQGPSILTETGAMRNSFFYRATGKTLSWGLTDEKTAYHQPDRPIIGMTEERFAEIAKMIKSYITKGV